MARWRLAAVAALITGSSAFAQTPARIVMAARILPSPAAPGKAVKPFVKEPAGKIALIHVRVIDGTGASALEDRTLLIDGQHIASVLPTGASIPEGYRTIDASGHSILPGIVGMHDHQFYIAGPNLAPGHFDAPLQLPQMGFSSPRLYLAGGVTTLRTTGSVEPYSDLNMKTAIDAGVYPGPHMDVTAPYLEGPGSPFVQMHPLKDAAEAARMVNFWADQGVTSFKAYMNISRAQLKAAIDAAHARGIKVTGHLCSVTYPEAAALGIDNLEHGFFPNTQADPGKTPDRCSESQGEATLEAMTPGSAAGQALIAALVKAKVAITSTLPVFEDGSPGYAGLPARQLDIMTAETRNDYLQLRLFEYARSNARKAAVAAQWANALAMERAFVAAGGLLIAGPDPTGGGNVLPGFGDQRAIELLVQAGFSPVEAIRIGTLNGATYLGLADHIGSIAPGKNADLILVKGDPSTTITDIEKVITVFKDGTGYDAALLLGSVRGRYGQY